jgi:formyltetrahydrofolate deformylase
VPVPVHILTMSCPDRPGIVASMSQGLLDLDANIIDNAQHSDPASGLFCMRTRFDAPFEHASDVAAVLQPRADALAAALHVRREDQPPKVASKQEHCLYDLLIRWRAGELACQIGRIISNHEEVETSRGTSASTSITCRSPRRPRARPRRRRAS